MTRYYNKDELKEALEIEQIYDIVESWGGEPEYTKDGLIAQTICHNAPGEGSRKLYYYNNTHLFRCYTNCGSFDIFDLCIKVMKKQKGLKWELYNAMDYIASYFGLSGVDIEDDGAQLEDWEVFKRHHYEYQPKKKIQLKEYNPIILTRFSYPRIAIWEKEGISPEISKRNLIGYYPGGEQITIPHFDIDNRLIGIRGRSLDPIAAARYGKYKPLRVNKQLYNHPLSMNLYNLNNSKNMIAKMRTAVVFESEKSCLMYQSYFGPERDISVAVCGSSFSSYQASLLYSLGVREVILAFDRQFQAIGDDEFKRLKSKLIHFNKKYNSIMRVTSIFDKNMITAYKSSPIDEGADKFKQLLSERIVPE